jgi:hypothetical protein
MAIEIPTTAEEWRKIVTDYQIMNEQHGTFPTTVDEKRVTIRFPAKGRSDYFNYKKDFSIILLL